MQFGNRISEEEVTRVALGHPVPFFQGGFEAHRGQDFAVLETVENGPLVCMIYLSGLDATEQKTLSSAQIRARVVREGSMVQTLIRFMGSSLIFELSHDPTLYQDKRSLRIGTETNLITVIGADSNTNIVKTLRAATLPRRLCEEWQKAWTAAFDTPNFSVRYTSWVNYLAQRYSVSEMWERAVDVGRFGE